MGLKLRLLMGMVSRIESKHSVPRNNIGRFSSVALYSTDLRVVNECCDADNGIVRLKLAKNLSNLVEETVIDHSMYEAPWGRCDNMDIGKMALTKNLASVVQESYDINGQNHKSRTRQELKRFLETRIKKRVKGQFTDGKFRCLLMKVVADASTLKDAYDCIRVNSNVDLASVGDNLSFGAMAEELASGSFDICANTYGILTRGPNIKKEKIVFPKLKLRIVQEAIRVVLEVVYRPHFSKISHGFRCGRSHLSALKYICKEISNPDWWFTVVVNKKLDECILNKLISSMEEKIDDPGLFGIIRDMFNAGVLNLEFGSFVKGQGLPQEGVLSPILMNIYLDLFDREVYKMSMQYEISEPCQAEETTSHSKLRGWFRRQLNGNDVQQYSAGKNSSVRVHCCRFMDEIFFAVLGPREVALAFKSEIESFLNDTLHLEVDNRNKILASSDSHGIQFLGTCIKRRLKETIATRAVHKLKDKVRIFAEQKQKSWDEGAFRISKKWLAHGLKKVKESEIKHLMYADPLLHKISCYRKPGMKTDHWYKVLLKIWMEDVNAKCMGSEELVLARNIIEPALPKTLTDSYYEFQKQANEYVASETAATLALLSSNNPPPDAAYITEILVPVKNLMKRLSRYGLTNTKGFARTCYVLILLDDNQIIDWFSGIARRWFRWYSDCDNFYQVKQIISNELRMSCIRTLASKYRIHEREIAKKFEGELSIIPSVEFEEANVELTSSEYKFDGALMYGIDYSGVCLMSLARTVSQPKRHCSVIGCTDSLSCIYALHVMERQKFPGWKTGFSSAIHPGLHRRRIGMCKKHVKDLFLGEISLQSVDFGGKRSSS